MRCPPLWRPEHHFSEDPWARQGANSRLASTVSRSVGIPAICPTPAGAGSKFFDVGSFLVGARKGPDPEGTSRGQEMHAFREPGKSVVDERRTPSAERLGRDTGCLLVGSRSGPEMGGPPLLSGVGRPHAIPGRQSRLNG